MAQYIILDNYARMRGVVPCVQINFGELRDVRRSNEGCLPTLKFFYVLPRPYMYLRTETYISVWVKISFKYSQMNLIEKYSKSM